MVIGYFGSGVIRPGFRGCPSSPSEPCSDGVRGDDALGEVDVILELRINGANVPGCFFLVATAISICTLKCPDLAIPSPKLDRRLCESLLNNDLQAFIFRC